MDSVSLISKHLNLVLQFLLVVSMSNIFLRSKELECYMKHYNFELPFSKCTTNYNSQLDHIWTNAIQNGCQSRSIEAYWIDHNSIHCI